MQIKRVLEYSRGASSFRINDLLLDICHLR